MPCVGSIPSLFSGDGVARWLAHVDLLLEVAVVEGGLHAHVVALPPLFSHQREKDTDRFHARHGAEGVVVVDPILLDEAAC